MKNIKIYSILILMVSLILTSCSEDWLDVDPSDLKNNNDKSIGTVPQVEYAVNGMYNQLQSNGYYNSDYIALFDVMADDMRALGIGRLDDYYRYGFYTESSHTSLWVLPLRLLKDASSLMSKIDKVKTDTEGDEAKLKNLKGQALVLRALAHFDLVRVFGKPYSHGDFSTAPGAPIVIEPVLPGDLLKRSTVEETYEQIIKDLEQSLTLLSKTKSLGYINYWAAKALLSRVYLYKEDNQKAFDLAVEVIKESPYQLVPREKYVESWANDIMEESLFSIINTSEDSGPKVLENLGFLSDPNGYGNFVATDKFIALLSSDPDDVRNDLLSEDKEKRAKGRVLKYPGKTNQPSYTSNTRLIRLSEVYLNAAEAAIKLGSTEDAKTYLNAIYKRATGKNIQETVTLDRVLEEREKELVAEGHRFFDLVRNKKTIERGDDYWGANEYKVVDMSNHKLIQPIPRSEINVNPSIQQNKGYAK